MRLSLLLAVALTVAPAAHAATGVEHMLRHKPAHVYVVVEGREALEGCLAPALANRPSIIHGPGRTDIIYANGGVMMSLIEQAPVTRIEVRSILGFFPAPSKTVRKCVHATGATLDGKPFATDAPD